MLNIQEITKKSLEEEQLVQACDLHPVHTLGPSLVPTLGPSHSPPLTSITTPPGYATSHASSQAPGVCAGSFGSSKRSCSDSYLK